MTALDAARAALAPQGLLRAAINTGNPVLATRGEDGAMKGVSVDLAHALARALGARLDLVAYDGAGKVVAEAGADRWDLAFLAVDPTRGEKLAYTRPYVRIEAVFAAPARAAFAAPADLDRAGLRIGVGKGAAYDLHLSRAFSRATLARYPTSADVGPAILADGLDAGAGIRQPMQAFVAATPGLRLLPDAFMAIAQALAVPRAKAAAVPWLQEELDRLAARGVIREALRRAGEDPALATD